MDESKFEIRQTNDKGRVLCSKVRFETGDLVLTEEAFVYAAYGDEDEELDDQWQAMIDVEGIDELDRAKTVIKCLEMDRETVEKVFEPLTAANIDSCKRTAKLILDNPDSRALVPESAREDVMFLAKTISVLNTNSHELEDIGGSGLFPTACICEHSCIPNCNFSSKGNRIYLTCLRGPINPGDSISIDYGNHFYRPTSERREELRASYEFDCMCDCCIGKLPDRCRAFVCPNDKDHVVCAFGDHSNCDFKCLNCDFVALCGSEQAKRYLDAEEAKDKTLVREEHCIFFEPLAEAATRLALSGNDSARAVELWKQVVGFVELVLPTNHPEIPVHYEKLAQVLIQDGQIDEAKKAYEKAYQLAVQCTGAPEISVLSTELLRFATKTPTSVAELQQMMADD